jgi:hypothetical protein
MEVLANYAVPNSGEVPKSPILIINQLINSLIFQTHYFQTKKCCHFLYHDV